MNPPLPDGLHPGFRSKNLSEKELSKIPKGFTFLHYGFLEPWASTPEEVADVLCLINGKWETTVWSRGNHIGFWALRDGSAIAVANGMPALPLPEEDSKTEGDDLAAMRRCYFDYCKMFPWTVKGVPDYDAWILSDDDHAVTFRQGWSNGSASLAESRAEVEELERHLILRQHEICANEHEITALRAIFPAICEAIGNGACCTETASVDFLREIPKEVGGVISEFGVEVKKYASELQILCDTIMGRAGVPTRFSDVRQRLLDDISELTTLREEVARLRAAKNYYRVAAENAGKDLTAFCQDKECANYHRLVLKELDEKCASPKEGGEDV